MKTILTGIRINSDLTLGNFLGAMLPMVRLANRYSSTHHINIFVPDLHSIISETDGDLQSNMLRTIRYYLAAGLELNENVHFYRQSYVPAHTELAWILNCHTTMGEALRMTQYKDKSHNGNLSTNVGIFDYPILMAADILLYSANYVPVGEDQFQHIELTRNIAERFNHKYGEIFTIPENTENQVKFMYGDTQSFALRIRDLMNPEKKMSKSADSDNSKIMLADLPERIRKKIMSATTDSLADINFDFKTQPGISNLLQILAAITDTSLHDLITSWQHRSQYGELKKLVAERLVEHISNFQAKVQNISDEEIYQLLEEGEKYANQVANQKLLEVQKAVGLR